MKRLILSGALISSLLVGSALAADSPAPVISALNIKKQTADDVSPNLFSSTGVTFAIVLAEPKENIVGIDEDASKLISAVDDKGTDLAENAGSKWTSAFFSKISKNRQKIGIPITLKDLPAAGATVINFKAEVALICGSDEKTETIAVDPSKAAPSKLGENSITISEGKGGGFFGGGASEGKKQTLDVKLDNNGTWLKSIDFLDEKGAVLKSDSAGSMSSGGSVTKNFTVPKDAKVASVKVTYFGSMKTITRAIDLKIGVGL